MVSSDHSAQPTAHPRGNAMAVRRRQPWLAAIGLGIWLMSGAAHAGPYSLVAAPPCCLFDDIRPAAQERVRLRLRCGDDLCDATPESHPSRQLDGSLGSERNAASNKSDDALSTYPNLGSVVSFAREALAAITPDTPRYRLVVERDQFNARNWGLSYRDHAIPLPVGLTAAVEVDDPDYGEEITYIPRLGFGADWRTRNGNVQLDVVTGLESAGEDIRLQLKFEAW
jgi:hypothetical protein